MSEENTYSNEQELQALARRRGLIIPATRQVADVEQPIEEVAPTEEEQLAQMTPMERGALVAEKIARFAPHGYKPTFQEAMEYRPYIKAQESNAWASIGGAMVQTAEDLGAGAYELAGDVLTLKVPKVVGSLIEGAAVGTKSWMYMYEEAQYNEDSFLHKMLFDTHRSDEEYYFNLLKSLEARQAMEKDQKEGVLLPREIEIGGVKLDLWNPAVVQGISYVADPSWIAPNLGIETTIAKGMRSATTALAIGDQLAQAGMWASKKASIGAGSVADASLKVSNTIVKVEDDLLRRIKETTGIDAFIGVSGNVVDKDDLGRGAMAGVGLNQVRIPAWGITTLTWGATKVVEVGARALELGTKLSSEAPKFQGMRLSERMAMESTNPTVRALSGTWAKTGSPLVEWATHSLNTSIHSGMYGGAFGFMFGGEEGFYNGIGSGFVIGGAFHQIGAMHNVVAGGDAPRDVQKNFLWATSHYDYHNQKGLFKLLENVTKEGGEQARLSVMADIASSERLQRDVRRLILTEEEIKKRMTSEEWNDYEAQMLANAEGWGGVAFRQALNGEKVTIINADRATTSAVKEELFHTLMMDERYGASFQREAIHTLIGTEDDKGALYRMPKPDAVRLLESFKDAYLGLESDITAGKADPTYFNSVKGEWEQVIKDFRDDVPNGKLSKLYEEFLAAYWNRFVEDKPIDYLLKGGDLGLIRNTIQKAKDSYMNVMHQDLVASGAKFKFGDNPDHFFLDQTTKQRVRIPKLEKLMEHFVKEASKEMYSGWTKSPRDTGTFEKAFANQLEHLFSSQADGSVRMLREEEVDKSDTESLKGAIEEISGLAKNERGLKITVVGGNADGSNFSFARGRKPKKDDTKIPKGQSRPLPSPKKTDEGWGEVARQLRDEGESLPRLGITQETVKTVETTARDESPDGGWATDKRKKFWESIWNGNPRLKLTGVASSKELAVLNKWLPTATVTRFKELNSVIEMSRMGQFSSGVSNLLTAEVMTRTKENNDGTRNEKGKGEYYSKKRNFIPVELNLYFERKLVSEKDGIAEYKTGKAQLLLKTIDHDALIKRIDYAWNEWNARDMNSTMVRKMFGTKENLYVAIKDLLSRYSNSEIKEGGARLFEKAGASSKRDAGHMRDIVNAVIGFHPTVEMVRKGEFSNPWLNLQRRTDGKKVDIPTVMTDFNVRRIGTVRSLNGEGFYYDHENGFVRSQYNHSPARTSRDHEGNPMSLSERTILNNTLYRNKDGEILAVYNLKKFNHEPKARRGASVFDMVDDGVGRAIDASSPRMRGRQYYSESGWLHYTPDMAEASMLSGGSMRTGYIDTQSHLDISQIPFNSNIADAVEVIATRISQLTKATPEQVVSEIAKLTDIHGNLLGDMLNRGDNVFNTETDILDNWLFTKDFADYLKKTGIQSVEYVNENPLTGSVSTAVAIWDNGRFIENTSRRAEANFFAFSPAKRVKKGEEIDRPMMTLAQTLQARVNKAQQETFRVGQNKQEGIMEAFLDMVISEDGESVISNPRLITEEILEGMITKEFDKWYAVTKGKKGMDAFTDKTVEEIKAQLKPAIIESLRKEMQFAPTVMLNSIADIALSGVTKQTFRNKSVSTVTQAGDVTQKDLIVLKDTVLLRLKKAYGVDANKIEKTGIPMLAHLAEMTEAEFQIVKAIPDYLDALKKGKGVEWASNPDNNKLLLELYGKHGGAKKFLKKFDDRQKDIFFLLDKQITTGVNLENGDVASVFNSRKLRELFVEKTKAYVFETFRRRKMNLQETAAFDRTRQRYRDFSVEEREMRAIAKMYTDNAKAILTEEFNERVLDTLTALNIKVDPHSARDREIVEKVRATLYNQAKQGLIKLGTPHAIQESVRLYFEYERLGTAGTSRVIDTRLALKKGLLQAMNELESKGYVGINFAERGVRHEIIAGKKQERQHYLTIEKGEGRFVRNIWDFEGSTYKIVEEGYDATQSLFTLLNTVDNSVALSMVVNKEGVGNAQERRNTVSDFVRLSTNKLNQLTPSLILTSGKFGAVVGPMKNYILHSYFSKSQHADLSTKDVFGYENWDVYKSGDTFVAFKRYESDDNHASKLEAKIDEVKRQLKSGNVKIPLGKNDKKGNPLFAYRKGTIEEQIKLRTQLTELQSQIYTDKGLVLQVDGVGEVTVLLKANNIKELNDALRAVKGGKGERLALEKYIEEMYRGFKKVETKHTQAERQRINRVLSDGPNGNLAQIKALESIIRDSESDLKQEVFRRLALLKKEAKTDKTVKASALTAYREILLDIDSSRKAVSNAMDRILAIEYHLHEIGAFPEFNAMNEHAQNDWLANTYKFTEGENSFIMNQMPMNQGENPVMYAQRLRNELMRYKNEHALAFTRNSQLVDLVNGAKEGSKVAKEKARFLVEQYLAAKGVKFTKKAFDELFDVTKATDASGEETGATKTTIRTEMLKKLGAGRAEPRYIADNEGVIGPRERYETLDDLRTSFLEGIVDIKENWRGLTQTKVARINSLIERNKAIQEQKTKPVMPKQKKGQTDANFELEMEKYNERLRAWEGGYGFLLPAEGTPKTLADNTGSGRPDKKQEILKKTVIRDNSQYNTAVRDANYEVAKNLEEITGESKFLLDEVIASGRKKVASRTNPEVNFTEEFSAIVDSVKLKFSEEVFVRDPINKAFVDNIQGRLASGEINETQAIAEIRRETMLSELSGETKELYDADTRLKEAEDKISTKQYMLDELAYLEQTNPNGLTADQLLTKDRLNKELNIETAKARALQERISTIISVQEREQLRDVMLSLMDNSLRLERNIADKQAQIDYVEDRSSGGEKLKQEIISLKVDLSRLEKRKRELEQRTRNAKEQNEYRGLDDNIANTQEAIAQAEMRQSQRFDYEDYQELIDLKQELASLEAKKLEIDADINQRGGTQSIGTPREIAEIRRKRSDAQVGNRDFSSVQIAKYTRPEFLQMVESIRQRQKNIQAMRDEDAQRSIARRQHNEAMRNGVQQFIMSFNEDAKKLGYSSSALLVSPNNPRTRLLYQAFPTISHDLYGSKHPLDWSGSGYHIEATQKGEQTVRFGSSNDPAYQLHQQEQTEGRRLFFLADYMYYARQRAEWHKNYPDQAITAEEAMLIQFLVPEDVYKLPQEKLDSIGPEAIREQQRISDGIMDRLDYGNNKERFIRAFTEDALKLVVGSMDSRAKAYMRIFELTEEKYNQKISGMSEEQVKAMLMNKEVIENAMYWLSDKWITLNEGTRKKYQKLSPTKDGKEKASGFTTDILPIDSLIKMDGFRKVLDEVMVNHTTSSIFDGMPMAKVEYEAMPNAQRMDLDITTVQRLALENDAGMLRYQASVQKERGEKPVWFADRMTEASHTGHDADFYEVELNRMNKILSTTMSVEASIAKFKDDVQTFTKKRPQAVSHMLSLDDGLKFHDLTFDPNNNDALGRNFRESADGRYIIQRKTVTSRNGNQSDSFSVFFVGEKVKTADGALAYEIDTSLIGSFNNTTDAQVMVRFFEDDLRKLKLVSQNVTGGANKFDPLRVLDTILPRARTGTLIGSLEALPAFSNAVIEAYDRNKGNPRYSQQMRRMLESFGRDFGEPQLVSFTANGRVRNEQITISPSRYGVMSKYFDRTIGDNGQVLWVQKTTKEAQTQQSATTAQQATNNQTSSSSTNQTHDTSHPDLPKASAEDKIITDASTFRITSQVQKEGQVYEQWQTLKNKLNYQIVRGLDESGKRDIFKLFNPASVYMGAYTNEQDAVDEIVEAEFLARRK
jgi:hypothetical protein